MKYTVGKTHSFESKFIEESGLYKVQIKKAYIKKARFISKEMREMGMEPDEINILMETDKNEIIIDRIGQEVNETLTLVFKEGFMNNYSNAVDFEIGTTFNTIEDWLNALAGKYVFIEVEAKEVPQANGEIRKYANVRKVSSISQELNF